MARNKTLKRKVRNSYLISTLSISLVLFLLGSVGYMMVSALDVARKVSESIVASVELASNLSESQRTEIQHKIAAYPLAGDVRFSSKGDKINDEEFRKMFGLEFEEILEDNPLMDSFEVVLTSHSAERSELERFAKEVGAIKGVTRVGYPALLVEQVHATVGKFQLLLTLFGGALLFISLVLLNNTIRLAIFSKRAVINTMKLVGATKWFIVRPFLASSLWSGFWAGAVASILFGGVLYALQENLIGMVSMAQLYDAAWAMGAMIVGGMLISLIFTWFAVGRFVNMKSQEIHLY
ncbi:MAG: permease-like cell division protein FtsX [Rikenellaceae bacterium]